MKKLIFLLAFLLFKTVSIAQDQALKVVATASIFADMASVIAGDLMKVSSIVPIGGDPHIYEPTPRDLTLVTEADLILRNGLTFEGWLNELIENSGTTAPSILITEGIDAIESLTYKNSADPHAWMDVENGLIYIKNIKNAFVELDPSNREIYEFNYKVYKQQLEELHQYIINRILEIPPAKRILVTSHDAFQYYGRKYGLQLEAILGVSTDADVQTSDITRVTRSIKQSGIPAVFIESTINPKLLEQIASDNKVRIGGKLFSDSIGNADSEAPDYYQMLKYNTDTIVEALKQAKANVEGTSNESSGNNSWIFLLLTPLIAIIGLLLVIRKVNG